MSKTKKYYEYKLTATNDDEIDLRYIIGNSRIIITSRATSTIGWCMLSGKPVMLTIPNPNKKITNKAMIRVPAVEVWGRPKPMQIKMRTFT